jgi:hypothetical protein
LAEQLVVPATLMVDASVHVASDDGTFVADGTSTIGYSVNRLDFVRLTVPADELDGTFSITYAGDLPAVGMNPLGSGFTVM